MLISWHMSTNQSPVIQLVAGGAPVQVNIDTFTGPLSDQLETTSALTVTASQAPSIATIALHPTNPRAVIVTPGTSAGSIAMFVSETPAPATNLAVNVQTTLPPNVRQVAYNSHGPVTA